MDRPEAKRIAKLSAPSDPAQQRITEAALREVGAHTISVREVPGGEPPWQAYDVKSGNALSFSGLFIYGGENRAEALGDARRIASKWDWEVVEPEAVA